MSAAAEQRLPVAQVVVLVPAPAEPRLRVGQVVKGYGANSAGLQEAREPGIPSRGAALGLLVDHHCMAGPVFAREDSHVRGLRGDVRGEKRSEPGALVTARSSRLGLVLRGRSLTPEVVRPEARQRQLAGPSKPF